MGLRDEVQNLVDARASADKDAVRAVFEKLRAALSAGEVRAAEPDASSPVGWRVNAWVKQGILLGSGSATRKTCRPITAGGRSSTRTRCR